MSASQGSLFSFDSCKNRWAQRQCGDPVLLKLRYYLHQRSVEGFSEPAGWDKAVVEFIGIAHKLLLVEDVIFFEYGVGVRELAVPIVPLGDLPTLVKQLHIALDHAGRDKLLKVARTKIYHPKLAKAVIKVVQECQLCQVYKGRTINKFLFERRVAKYPNQVYAMDLMDLPKTKSGFVCVMVGIDCFSRYGHAVALKNKTSKTVAKALEGYVLSRVPSTPEVIFTDGGPEYKGREFNQVLARFGIRHDYSVPFLPHSNGGVERFNQTLKQRLMLTSAKRKVDWDQVLHVVVAQYNRTIHDDTGIPPVSFFVPHPPQLNTPTTKTGHCPIPIAIKSLIFR